MRFRWMCALAVGFWGLGVLPAEGSHRFQKARELIVAEVASGNVPAFAVAVARGDEVLWEEAFGDATTDTPFSLASVSKPLTATALMVLVERELVELDRPVNDYLGDVPLRARVGNALEATVRRVANHTSGLPLHHHFFPHGSRPPPLAETIRRYGNLVTEPGERWEYSNLGYAVIEHLIERVSKQDYPSFMEEEVFRPLGMHDTAVVLDPETESRPLAARYDADGKPIPFYDFDHRGASAIFSSVGDLLRFGMFHVRAFESSILSRRAIAEMQKPKARMPGGRHYGVGWMLDDHRWGRVVEHGGDMPGVSTSLYLIPDRKIVVVALAAARSGLPEQVTDAVVESLLGRFESPYRRVQLSAAKRAKASVRERSNPKSFVGVWDGAIETPDGTIPLRLTIDRELPVRARLGDDAEIPLMGVSIDGDQLTAMMRSTPASVVRLSLYRRRGGLSGAATILSENAGLPQALSHWAELEKQEASAR